MPHSAIRHAPLYSCLQVPAEKGQSHSVSMVNTGAGGNVLPLCMFGHLYPDQISQAGLPTGLDHISTWLTTYNRSPIPLYGALHGPITWQPDCPGAWPHRVNLYWYVADTPGPALLGLPWSEKLAVVKMNCASQSCNLAQDPHILHQLPQQQQISLSQLLQQPSPSGPLMTW